MRLKKTFSTDLNRCRLRLENRIDRIDSPGHWEINF